MLLGGGVVFSVALLGMLAAIFAALFPLFAASSVARTEYSLPDTNAELVYDEDEDDALVLYRPESTPDVCVVLLLYGPYKKLVPWHSALFCFRDVLALLLITFRDDCALRTGGKQTVCIFVCVQVLLRA